MGSEIQEVVFEALDNAVGNGYPHDYTFDCEQYVHEMVEQGVFDRDLTLNEFDAAVDAVEYWRLANK